MSVKNKDMINTFRIKIIHFQAVTIYTEILLKVAFNNITQTPHLFVGAISPENYWIDGSDSLVEGEWRWMMQDGNSQPITGYT